MQKAARLHTRLALLATLALGASACQRGGKAPPPRPPVPVSVAEAQVRDVPVELRAVGNVQPFSTVVVTPRVAGQLMNVAVREGQDVQAGDLLFRIDSLPYALALRQAQANLARDRAQLANARSEAARYQGLAQHDLASREDVEARAAAAQALAATVRSDLAAVDAARTNLGYTTLRSPITGRTGVLQVNAGNVVRVDQPLITIRQMQPIYVGFSVPAKDLQEVRARNAAAGPLQVEAAPPGQGQPHAGRLSFVDNAVDPATGTVLLKATFDNADRALWPGEFVQTALRLQTLLDQVVVPSAAVQTGQQGEFLFVVDDQGIAQMRAVALGPTSSDGVVVERGVRPGERVVTDGQLNLTPGAKVQISQPPRPQPPQAPPSPAVGGAGQ